MRRRCIESAYGTLTAMIFLLKDSDIYISITQTKTNG